MQHPYEGQEYKTNTLNEIKFNNNDIQLEKICSEDGVMNPKG